MDMSADLCDWEVLQNSDASGSGTDYLGDLNCHAIFQSDYFTLDSHQKPPSSDDDGSAASDNPSWIDPGSDAPFPARKSADFWSDSGSDLSFTGKPNDADDKLESQVISAQVEAVKYWSDYGDGESTTPFSFNEELGAHGVGIGVIQHPIEDENDGNKTAQEAAVDDDDGGSSSDHNLVIDEINPGYNKKEGSRVIWWKLPLDLLHCVFRVSPVWPLSVAAALVGFIILGRRLYKMKPKTRGLQLKLIIDDKMVSQFMSHAARFNEAFSLVRRVPIIRPSLPGLGAAPWPAMSMRH